MAWMLYVLFAALSLVDIVLVFAGGVGWFGGGTLGLLGASIVTLIGPGLVYSSASGSTRGARLGTTSFGPAFAIGISITTFFAASAIWRAATDSGTTSASRVMAGVVAVVVCAMLAGAPGALRLQVERLGLGRD